MDTAIIFVKGYTKLKGIKTYSHSSLMSQQENIQRSPQIPFLVQPISSFGRRADV